MAEAFGREVLKSLLFGLTNMNKAGFKLLLRRDNFLPVGIITVKRPEIDSARGLPRNLAEGVLLEPNALRMKRWFREPLDRWNKITGIFESTVLCENNSGIVLTSRRSFSLDDEDDKNFMLLENPLDAEEHRKIRLDSLAKERTISSVTKLFKEAHKNLDFFADLAESSGIEARDLKTRLGILQKQNYLLQAQVDQYKLESMAAEALSVQLEAAVRKILEDARAKGVELASSETERAIAAIKKQRQMREEGAGLFPTAEVAPEELKKIRARQEEMSKQLEELARRPREREKPAEKEKPAIPPASSA